jgi:hypothetical protein
MVRVEFIVQGSHEVMKWMNDNWVNKSESFLVETIGYSGSDSVEKLNHNVISDNEFWVSCESKDFVPQQLLETLEDYLIRNVDPNVMIQGEYWEEQETLVGVFYINEMGWEYEEGYVDENSDEWEENNPDGFYYDEVIRPMIDELKNDLGEPSL